MRRGLVIFLLLLYIIPTIGVSVSSHYCGGKLASVSLKLLDMGHKCPCGDKPMKKSCCKDEVKTFKLKSEQQKSSQLALNYFKAIAFQPISNENFDLGYHRALIFTGNVATDHPPDNIKQPLYLQQRVFRI